jgi:hypothetical protein
MPNLQISITSTAEKQRLCVVAGGEAFVASQCGAQHVVARHPVTGGSGMEVNPPEQ